MNVIKIGGGCLREKEIISTIIDLISTRCRGDIVILSAFYGVTDTLVAGMDKALESEENIPGIIQSLRKKHHELAGYLIDPCDEQKKISEEIDQLLTCIERYYFGLSFTREATPRMQDMITSYGERMSTHLITMVLKSRGCNADCIMPHTAGIVTDGKYSDATALIEATAENFERSILPMLTEDKILLIPGFFGASTSGEITTFGRGGSDYSAAVVAAAIGADTLEVWKDTKGFMSADPKTVPTAKLIEQLSYGEAAELAYSGASILHPRTVEPVRSFNIPIRITNTLAPDTRGSLITAAASTSNEVIKSVSHTREVSILKVHASGVGARIGILADIAGKLRDTGINIKSVVTSQTCISLLLSPRDIDKSYLKLEEITPRPYRTLEKIENVALINIVGDGLHNQKGIAAKCFTAVSDAGVNIEMISFGPSKSALYFIVQEPDLEKSVKALHSFFFDSI